MSPSFRRPFLVALLVVAAVPGGFAHADVIYSTLNAAPPVQGVNYFNQTTGQFTGPRLFRDAVPSACGTPKAHPGSFGAGPYRYDAYHFTATETTCLTFRLRRISASGIIHMALHSSIDPVDGSVGWLADSGSSVVGTDGSVGFSFNVVAGQTYILLLYHTNPNEEGGQYEASYEEPFTGTHESVLDPTAPTPSLRYLRERSSTFSGNRIYRDGVQSSCGTARTFPGTAAAPGPFRYDAYEFMSPVTGCVTVSFQRTASVGNVHVAAYSAFDPGDLTAGWLADAGMSTGTGSEVRSFSVNVTAGQVLTLVVFNVTDGEEGAGYRLTVDLPMQPPTLFRAATVAGNLVTFRWKPPLNGPAPDNYVIEGGVNPGEVLASIPAGSGSPLLDVTVPNGAFYVRVRGLNGPAAGPASNEIRVFVNALVPPSAPRDLLAVVNGTTLGLTWRNTFEGGAPTSSVLDVTGSATTSINLGPGESGAFTGVPGGSYTLRLRSLNAAGASVQSAPVAITIPGACSGIPQPPPRFLAYKSGSRITVVWDAPATGPAPSSFVLEVTGTIAATIPTSGRSLSGVVAPGTYNLAVRSVNACGTSVLTPAQTVTIP